MDRLTPTVLALAFAASACTGNQQKQKVKETDVSNDAKGNGADRSGDVTKLKQHLAAARKQSDSYLNGEALPARADVLAIVEGSSEPWWESLSPEETFLLFEISPATAERAPVDVRARAYCAGVDSVSAEWWGTPGSTDNEVSRRLVAVGKPAAQCLAALFDSDKRLKYMDGEMRSSVKEYGWTVADLAAGLAAKILGESYDTSAPSAERVVARAKLRTML